MNFLKSLDEREIVIYKKLKEVEQLKYTEAEIKKVESPEIDQDPEQDKEET